MALKLSDACDLHCHLLPGLDDGARELEESHLMLRLARQQGIGVIAATPHLVLDGRQEQFLHHAIERFRQLRTECGKERGLKILLGFELYLDQSIFTCDNLRKFCIGESKLLLFEAPPDCTEKLLHDAVLWVLEQGLTPVMAHPERTSLLPGLDDLCSRGLMLQLNSSSITGHSGLSSMLKVKRLAKSGLPFVLGSDAHSPAARPPAMLKAVGRLERWIGSERTLTAAVTRPRALLGLHALRPEGRAAIK